MPYRVLVDDNFHYMDEAERYELGVFETWDAALAASKQIVDEFLTSSLRPDITAKELFELYVLFGEDPFIVPVSEADERRDFSGSNYAKDQCAHLCRSTTGASEDGKIERESG